MSSSFPIQANFSKGMISPLAAARVDLDLWKQSLALCTNFQVLLQGGIRRRSGTRFVAEVADSSAISNLFPFSFNTEQSYVLDVNAGGKIQFIAERGYLGAPYQVSHPWSVDQIPVLSYAQFNDEGYFAVDGEAPKLLSRLGDTSWTLADAVFDDGPYLDEDTQGTTLTPAGFGSIVPLMTSNTLPSGTVADSVANVGAFHVFDHDQSTNDFIAATAGTLSYTPASPVVADAYSMQADITDPQYAPSRWTFEGYDGANWLVLDTRQGETGWVAGENRYYDFINETAFAAYRINWTEVNGGVNTRITELRIHQEATSQTPFNLTASGTAGINGGAGFQTADVGRAVSVIGSDGVRRWLKIAAVSSSTVVTVRVYGQAFNDLTSSTRWQLGAFSSTSGWPALVELYNERLILARTDAQPVTVWGTKSGVFTDMGISDPPLETDGLNITLLSSQQNELLWLAGDDDLVTGSSKQIRSIGPNDITHAFSAANITQRKGPNSGAKKVKPLSIGGVLVYVGAGGKRLRELVLNDQGRYVAPDLSVLGEQYFSTGIVGILYSEQPDPTIYAWCGDGSVVSVLYDRDQRAVAFARFEIAGGVVESAAAIPSDTDGFDDIYLVVRRTINGGTKRYIEVMERPFSHLGEDLIEDAFFVDCGLTYDGAPATVISGLDHLEGEDVVALADGGVVRDLTVTSGDVTLPYAASKVQVGLAYPSRARTLPFAGPGQDGYLFGRRVKTMNVFADVLETGSLKVGGYAEDRPMTSYEINRKPGNQLLTYGPGLISGPQPCQIDSSWARGGGQVDLTVDDPLPCLIRAITLQAESEP